MKALLLALALLSPLRAAEKAAPLLIVPGQVSAPVCPARGLILPGNTQAPGTGPGMGLAMPALPPTAIDLSREGQPVIASLSVTAERQQAAELAAKGPRTAAQEAVAKAKPALVESVTAGEWRGPGTTLSHACCGDAAPKLALILNHMGLPIDVIEAEMHYYAAWRLEDGNTLFIDPTIRQFFGGPRAPPTVPEVFVGTQDELHALFRRHAAAKSTSYDVNRIYLEGSRTRNAKMAELQRESPDRPDLKPLARLAASEASRRAN